jgi:hypothetical protein
LDASVGKEDPVEFDSSLTLCNVMKGVAQVGGKCPIENATLGLLSWVRIGNEIPLPSQSFYSLSGMGSAADGQPTWEFHKLW